MLTLGPLIAKIESNVSKRDLARLLRQAIRACKTRPTGSLSQLFEYT